MARYRRPGGGGSQGRTEGVREPKPPRPGRARGVVGHARGREHARGPRVSDLVRRRRVSELVRRRRVSELVRRRRGLRGVSEHVQGRRVSERARGPRVSERVRGRRVSERARGPRVSERVRGPQVSERARGSGPTCALTSTVRVLLWRSCERVARALNGMAPEPRWVACLSPEARAEAESVTRASARTSAFGGTRCRG